MNVLWYINCILILAGIAVLGISFVFASRIIAQLNTGSIKKRWLFLRVLIIVFLAGYLAFLALMPPEADINILVVGLVFCLGAVFVLLVCWITLHTVLDMRRIASLEQATITDPLLGIYNRRYLEQRLDEEVSRAQRHNLPLSILLLDVDHFKMVNDAYGHQKGDMVLGKLGQILKTQVRKCDLPARYGGDEVAILCPNTEEPEALQIAERIRRFIELAPLCDSVPRPDQFDCTVSMGVASLEDHGCESSELLRRADLSLYQAKRNGRNCVVLYSADLDCIRKEASLVQN